MRKGKCPSLTLMVSGGDSFEEVKNIETVKKAATRNFCYCRDGVMRDSRTYANLGMGVPKGYTFIDDHVGDGTVTDEEGNTLFAVEAWEFDADGENIQGVLIGYVYPYEAE